MFIENAIKIDTESRLAILVRSTEGIPKIIQENNDFFIFFHEKVYPRLAEKVASLQKMYSSNMGRPAEDPVRMLAAVLLQFYEKMADRQAAIACQNDLRWKYALHMEIDQPAFHPSLFTRFRQRLLKHKLESIAFDACLQMLIEEGWVKKRSVQRLDSTHVHGLLKHMSRLDIIRSSISKTLKILAECSLSNTDFFNELWDEYVEKKISHRSTIDTLKKKVTRAGEDANELIKTCESAKDITLEQMDLLKKVFEENYILSKDGEYEQIRLSKPGAIQNPHDPDAQWCTKSTTKDKNWIGYKTQTSETVRDTPHKKGEPTANTITAIVTQKATESDKAGLEEVLEQQENNGLDTPEKMYVDGAYTSGAKLAQAEQENWELRGPVPPPGKNRKKKTFTVDKFDVDLEQRKATCPAGKESTNCSRLEEGATGKVSYRIEWNQKICAGCPLASQCIGENQKHRTMTIGEYYMHLQKRRREMKTDEFEKEMYKRNGIEGTQSELVRGFEMRKARYRGFHALCLQNFFIGTACNLKRYVARMTWERKQANKVGR